MANGKQYSLLPKGKLPKEWMHPVNEACNNKDTKETVIVDKFAAQELALKS